MNGVPIAVGPSHAINGGIGKNPDKVTSAAVYQYIQRYPK